MPLRETPMRPSDNPFRAQRLDMLTFRPQGLDWPAIEQRLHELDRRAAIVGPEGSGKTTLLRELGARLQTQGYRARWAHLTRDRRQFPRETARQLTHGLGPRDVILFDGASHLALPHWRRFRWRARRAGGLIITAHAGRRLPRLLWTQTGPRLLAALVEELLEQAGCPHAPAIDTAELCRRHRGNIRAALRELYDRFAALPRTVASPDALSRSRALLANDFGDR